MPLFSIIVIHYQGTIPHDVFCRGIRSLQAQTFKDFEILAYHDGPLHNVDLAASVRPRATTSSTSTPTTSSTPTPWRRSPPRSPARRG